MTFLEQQLDQLEQLRIDHEVFKSESARIHYEGVMAGIPDSDLERDSRRLLEREDKQREEIRELERQIRSEEV